MVGQAIKIGPSGFSLPVNTYVTYVSKQVKRTSFLKAWSPLSALLKEHRCMPLIYKQKSGYKTYDNEPYLCTL